MIEIAKNGMVKKSVALSSGLPIYDFSLTLDPGMGNKFDYCTKKDLELLHIFLSKYEQESQVVAFVRYKGYRGYLPVYSLQQILFGRGY